MAVEKAAVDTSMKLASLGLRISSDELSDVVLPEDKKSTSTSDPEPDASEAESEEVLADDAETLSETEEPDEEIVEEEASEPNTNLRKQLELKEQQRKEWQSKYDASQAQMQTELQKLYNRVQQLEQGEPDVIPDDDFVDGKTLKKILQKPLTPQVSGADQQLQADNAWMQTQPDFAEINAYAQKHMKRLQNDPTISALQSRQAVFFAVKAQMLADRKTKTVPSKKVPVSGTERGGGKHRTSGNRQEQIHGAAYDIKQHMKRLGLKV